MPTLAPPAPVLRYHGAKWKIAPWIIRHFPPHTTYVEVFGGSAGVLLRKRLSPIEVYNDLDGEVVNFFRMLRERPEALARAVELTPYARAELETAREPADDPLEAARRFAVRSWMSIGGPTTQWRSGFRYRRDDKSQMWVQWNRLPAAIVATARRLKTITIENADWQTILRRYDAPETLFYCDPPYLGETRSKWGKFRAAYKHEFTDADHEALAEALQGIQGMVVISGYPSPLYAELYEARGWARRCMNTINQNGSQARECLWLNLKAQAAGVQPSLFETA